MSALKQAKEFINKYPDCKKETLEYKGSTLVNLRKKFKDNTYKVSPVIAGSKKEGEQLKALLSQK